MSMRRSVFYMVHLVLCILLCGCYNQGPITPDAWNLTEQQLDSISFYTTHHYTQGYNFVVSKDSLVILEQQNEMMPVPDILTAEIMAGDETMPMLSLVDSITLRRHERLVVADICMVPTDSVDSVWVKVARDQLTQGWLRESDLLKAVSPDDPISQFIDFFSDTHLLIFLGFCVIVGGAYGLRRLMRKGARIVHFNDIPSFYPTLLCLLIATLLLSSFVEPIRFTLASWTLCHLCLGYRHCGDCHHRRCPPSSVFWSGHLIPWRFGGCLCRRLCGVQRHHLILYWLSFADCLLRVRPLPPLLAKIPINGDCIFVGKAVPLQPKTEGKKDGNNM